MLHDIHWVLPFLGVNGAMAAAESSIEYVAAHTHCFIHKPTQRPLSVIDLRQCSSYYIVFQACFICPYQPFSLILYYLWTANVWIIYCGCNYVLKRIKAMADVALYVPGTSTCQLPWTQYTPIFCNQTGHQLHSFNFKDQHKY